MLKRLCGSNVDLFVECKHRRKRKNETEKQTFEIDISKWVFETGAQVAKKQIHRKSDSSNMIWRMISKTPVVHTMHGQVNLEDLTIDLYITYNSSKGEKEALI